jgi:SAM-dependent methyltransferase
MAVRSLEALLGEAETLRRSGWDLSVLGDRLVIAPLTWDFTALVERHARSAPDLLDLATGGGEWLASLAKRPPRTVATEAWPPNVAVAGQRLRALGVTLVETEAAPDNVDQRDGETRGRLPFPDQSFALVTSRHSSFVASEVARVLDRDGVFLTQQVGGAYGDFYAALDLPPPPASLRQWDLALAEEQLTHAGLRVVDSGQGTEVTSFGDVGAFVWYLETVPWTVENFSVEAHRAALERLHEQMANDGPLRVRLPAFWLKATKQ